MTAEIAILNRNAVVLAADSAVTISNSRASKSYNSANKLFSLSKYAPVAVMVFGGADMTGIPWETIIKEYRAKLGRKKFDQLDNYADDFVSFVKGYPSIDMHDARTNLARLLNGEFKSVAAAVERMFNQYLGRIGTVDEDTVTKFVNVAVSQRQKFLEALDTLPFAAGWDLRRLIGKHKREIYKARREVFENIPISRDSKKTLYRIAALSLTKKTFSDSRSGIVVAGFGEAQVFPAIKAFHCDGMIEGHLKFASLLEANVSGNMDSGIYPFAQHEMVVRFMEGIDPNYQTYLETAFETFMSRMADEIGPKFFRSKKRRELFQNALRLSLAETTKHFVSEAKRYRQRYYVRPILGSVRNLPKEDLAVLAESLVHLTSLKRRVSMDVESVGGPIDVAVISKGDGLVWIKRKHYFNQELNPFFMQKYFAEDVLSLAKGSGPDGKQEED